MGIANFNAKISEIQLFKESDISKKSEEEFVLMHSAIPVNNVEELKFKPDEFENYNFVEEDMLPGDFLENRNREVRKMNKLLFSITPNPLRVKLNSSFYQIETESEMLNIQFMDK